MTTAGPRLLQALRSDVLCVYMCVILVTAFVFRAAVRRVSTVALLLFSPQLPRCIPRTSWNHQSRQVATPPCLPPSRRSCHLRHRMTAGVADHCLPARPSRPASCVHYAWGHPTKTRPTTTSSRRPNTPRPPPRTRHSRAQTRALARCPLVTRALFDPRRAAGTTQHDEAHHHQHQHHHQRHRHRHRRWSSVWHPGRHPRPPCR